jgi:hypothetical protein
LILAVWTFLPALEFARRALRQRRSSVRDLAVRAWQIAPGEVAVAGPAFFLSGQLERITGWAFANEHPRKQMAGGDVVHGPTNAYLVRDAIFVDGRLFKGKACDHLHPRTSNAVAVGIDKEMSRAALYCTPGGIKYFGQWLMDDCNTYLLACEDGVPLSTAHPGWPHTLGYERWLDMHPAREYSARIRELVLYDDVGQNANKRARARRLRSKLLAHVESRPHPGAFILRGHSGQRRLLLNELEIAETLRASRGFRVVDPARMSVPDIVAACAGAATLVGVEGSGLMHGIALLPPGGKVLTLQPPNRFVGLYKHLTDRDGQYFGFVVGTSRGADFTANVDELERTLDLFPLAAS